MGKGIVDKLKEEYDIEEEWISLEIHPETPKDGISLKERFGEESLKTMLSNLSKAGKPYDIQFNELKRMPNSRLALEASEFAKDYDKFEAYHGRLFYTYFTEGKDIGRIDHLLDIAEEVGLDKTLLEKAFKEEEYYHKLKEAQEDASKMGITSTPTFIINDEEGIVGAQPIEVFRRTLSKLQNKK